jgi:hypothetical protein
MQYITAATDHFLVGRELTIDLPCYSSVDVASDNSPRRDRRINLVSCSFYCLLRL